MENANKDFPQRGRIRDRWHKRFLDGPRGTFSGSLGGAPRQFTREVREYGIIRGKASGRMAYKRLC